MTNGSDYPHVTQASPRRRSVRAHQPWDSPGRVDLHLEVPAWTVDALCAEIGVDVFFPPDNGDQAGRLAKEACGGCSVRAECLEWALGFSQWNDDHGIFGGTSPKERRALRRDRAEGRTEAA